MKRLIALSFSAIFGLTSSAADAQPAARKPNVVMIVADDLGYADVGSQGQSKDVKTPHIDSLAAAGVRFTNGYVTGPVCSPTRAGLLTGRYQQRFGFEANPQPQFHDVFGMPADQILLPELLKKSGYATGMFGKWHLGTKPEMAPHNRGFDEFFGFLGGAHRYVNNANEDAIVRNGKAVGEKEYLTDAFTREAVAFIDRHKSDPFFVYVPYNAPHSPLQAPDKYLSRFPDTKDPKRKTFLAMLSALDDGVGQILGKLREHKLEEDTLVIFFSDNGGPTPGNTSVNTPFRGRKGETLEGGVRVPFMLQWKSRLPGGKVDDRMVAQLDLFHTILAAAGTQPPADRPLDGVDLLPYLAGDKQSSTIHESLFWRFGPRRAIRTGNWKLQWNGDETPKLYDLSKDPGESTDLSADHRETAEKLLATYKAWDQQMMEPRWPGRLEGGPGGAGDDDTPAAPRRPRRAVGAAQ